MALIEVSAKQGATDAARYGPKKPAAKRIASKRATGATNDRPDRPVTATALMVIIATTAVVTMSVLIVARIPITIVLGKCGCCGDQ